VCGELADARVKRLQSQRVAGHRQAGAAIRQRLCEQVRQQLG
jgi:hypothetical protein